MSIRLMSRKSIGVIVAALGVGGCNAGQFVTPPDNTSQPAKITNMQAFYCANPAAKCADRGNPIPSGTNPPTNQSFMIWAWTPGTNTTELCVITPVHQGCAPTNTAPDSVGYPVTVTGADHTYILRMRIVGLNNATVDADSLIWQYP